MGNVTGRGFGRVLELARGVRGRLGPLWWYSLLVFAAGRVTDLLSMYFGVFFLPGALSENELGAVDPINRLVGFGAIPLTVVGTVAAKYLSLYHSREEYGKIKRFMGDMSWLALAAAVFSVAALAIIFVPLRARLHLDSPYLFLGLCGVAVLSCWQPLIGVVLQGMRRFYTSMAIGLVNVALRLVLCFMLIPVLGMSGYLFALTATGLVTIALGLVGLRQFLGEEVHGTSYREDLRGIIAFAWPVAVWTTGASLQGFVEPFVVKNFLPAQDAAGYYMVCRFGYIPTYLVGAVSFVLFPLLSHRHERGEDTQEYLRQALAVTAGVCAAGVVFMGLTMGWMLGLRAQWAAFQPYAPNVWLIGAIVTLDSINVMYITHEVACRKFSFLWALIPVILVECAVLYGSFGWGAFREILPADAWTAVNGALPHTLRFALWLMLAARVVLTTLLAYDWRRGVRRENQLKIES